MRLWVPQRVTFSVLGVFNRRCNPDEGEDWGIGQKLGQYRIIAWNLIFKYWWKI